MIYQPNWEKIQSRMLAYWNRESVDRCCASFEVRKPGYVDFSGNFYFETEKATEMFRKRFENTTYYADAFPFLFPYFGTAGIAEYTGCKPNRVPETTWFDHWMEDMDEPDAELIRYSHPEAFAEQKEAIRDLLVRSNNEYVVSVSDNAGVMDALAEVRGTENLMMDMLTDPEFVEAGLQKLLPIYKQTQTELFELVKENNRGCVHAWMQLWAPSPVAQMQCDLSVMLSPAMYERFILPELNDVCDFLDYSVYHFDGQEQIRHLDHLLSVKKLNAIQWTPVAGQPKTSEFIPVLQKIQKAGKNLVLTPDASEVQTLLDNLSSRGLQLVISGVNTEDEARDLMHLIETHSVDRG